MRRRGAQRACASRACDASRGAEPGVRTKSGGGSGAVGDSDGAGGGGGGACACAHRHGRLRRRRLPARRGAARRCVGGTRRSACGVHPPALCAQHDARRHPRAHARTRTGSSYTELRRAARRTPPAPLRPRDTGDATAAKRVRTEPRRTRASRCATAASAEPTCARCTAAYMLHTLPPRLAPLMLQPPLLIDIRPLLIDIRPLFRDIRRQQRAAQRVERGRVVRRAHSAGKARGSASSCAAGALSGSVLAVRERHDGGGGRLPRKEREARQVRAERGREEGRREGVGEAVGRERCGGAGERGGEGARAGRAGWRGRTRGACR